MMKNGKVLSNFYYLMPNMKAIFSLSKFCIFSLLRILPQIIRCVTHVVNITRTYRWMNRWNFNKLSTGCAVQLLYKTQVHSRVDWRKQILYWVPINRGIYWRYLTCQFVNLSIVYLASNLPIYFFYSLAGQRVWQFKYR